MTKRIASRKTNENAVAALNLQVLTPQQLQEQVASLEPFYEKLIGMSFDSSVIAIDYCRHLCAKFGFTVKQESSSQKNIYVYCSREGLPDSARKPKVTPQRKRPSKRCDCRWRAVLYKSDDHWRFRKSLNPDADKHNHGLLGPDEIQFPWPLEVTDLIIELAHKRLKTHEARAQIQHQFPNITWNERRFYNRLTEERNKIKKNDTIKRTQDLTQLWGQVCMTAAGSDDLCVFVKRELSTLFQSVCDMAQTDPQDIQQIAIIKEEEYHSQQSNSISEPSTPTSSNGMDENTQTDNDEPSQNQDNEEVENREPSSSKRKRSKETQSVPKGFQMVEIPKQVYYIKLPNQQHQQHQQFSDIPLGPRNERRPKVPLEEFGEDEIQPSRKLSRKGKGRQVSLVINNDRLTPIPGAIVDSHMQHHTMSPLMTPSYPNSRTITPITPPVSAGITNSASRQQQSTNTTFVYSYHNSMPLDTSSLTTNYAHSSFQNTYSIASSPVTPNFNTQDMTFSFSNSSMGGSRHSIDSGSNNGSNNEPMMNPVLQSTSPMSQRQQQQHQHHHPQHHQHHHHHHQQQQQHRNSLTPPSASLAQHHPNQAQSTNNNTLSNASNQAQQQMYSSTPPMISNSPIRQQSQQHRQSIPNSMIPSSVEQGNSQQQYQHHAQGSGNTSGIYIQQQQQQQHTGGIINPMYHQQSDPNTTH